MKKLFILLLVIGLNQLTFASPGWSENVKICKVQANGNGYANIQICGAYEPKVCGLGSWVRWELDITNGREMYATALYSMVLDKNVIIYAGAASDCTSKYDYITAIRVKR